MTDAEAEVIQLRQDIAWLCATVRNVADDIDCDEEEKEEAMEMLADIERRAGIEHKP